VQLHCTDYTISQMRIVMQASQTITFSTNRRLLWNRGPEAARVPRWKPVGNLHVGIAFSGVPKVSFIQDCGRFVVLHIKGRLSFYRHV